MKGFLLRWLINIAAMILVISIVPGIHSEGSLATVMAALVLGLINATLRPIVFALTLPLTILSLGIFTLFLNGFFFYLVSKIVEGFVIVDFWAAFWGALCFSAISFFLSLFVSPQGRFKVYRYRDGSGDPPPSHRQNHNDSDVIDVEAKVEDKDEEEEDGKK
ncbi:MAG: phage holin family protein [Candidatus Omnitrophica bacterium]|nr:phage holin family protein [Candidatus Omnitrophota bacterium]MDD5310509.1 phage holin family protein [Candidatus Omnitrophota bacterium]MDD5546065.1 phage holin family protein [Candidatus Omnitrophota bacterium]